MAMRSTVDVRGTRNTEIGAPVRVLLCGMKFLMSVRPRVRTEAVRRVRTEAVRAAPRWAVPMRTDTIEHKPRAACQP
ncbi:hypothetical protein GCM10027267_19060 [Paramicrobacterium agarici]